VGVEFYNFIFDRVWIGFGVSGYKQSPVAC
jgi:hypothetical protein